MSRAAGIRRSPAMGTPRSRLNTSRVRPWNTVSWWYSILFVIPVVIIAARMIFGGGTDPDRVVFRMVDQFTGQALAGVAVSGGSVAATSDADGTIRIDEPSDPFQLTATFPGYAPFTVDVVPGDEVKDITLQLIPTTLRGALTDANTGEPIDEADLTLTGSDGSTQEATTGEDGAYSFENVPQGATLSIDAGDYGTKEEAVGNRTVADYTFAVSTLTGQITDGEGEPLAGAVISAGDARGVTDDDGEFKLTGVADGVDVIVGAPGYLDAVSPLPAERTLSLALEPIMIKAIYAGAYTLSDDAEVERLIELIDETELNAIVLDIKEDVIFYDSQVPFFQDIEGMIAPTYDVQGLVAELRERDIYTIARMVIFKDPLVAESRPDLAVLDDNTGGLWEGAGVAWVNAFNEELWDANIELALEATTMGFDEIQYDYVRFPSDGPLAVADFGLVYTEEARVGAITEFMRRSYDAIRPTGAKFAADLFGIIGLKPDDQGIGQQLTALAPHMDYICLMIYPSHYIEGNIVNAPGHPNDYPYETILESLERAQEQLPEESRLKMRPWLQDFSLPGMSEYGPDEVAAQIQAAEDFGASGWILWDPSNVYTDAALDPA